MLKQISIQNFKSLKNISLPLRNLNVLMGLNGSGKSSLLQTLLLLRQSMASFQLGLKLQDNEGINLGVGKDILYQYADQIDYLAFSLNTDTEVASWIFEYDSDSDVLPLLDMSELKAEAFNLFQPYFQYLNAEHISPQETYKKSKNQVSQLRNIGSKGEFAAHYLAEYGLSEKIESPLLQHPKATSTTLIHQVDAWLSEISPGTRLVAENIKGVAQVRLAIKFETQDGFTNEIKPFNTGFGITYVLPVVLAILKARPGELVILENPESHLHPKGQSTIGRLMALAAQTGVQIIVETHSDHIVNGIRVAAKQGVLSPKNVALFYFQRILNLSEQYSDYQTIKIDKNGELSNYPDGFLDEWSEQLMKLI